MKPTLTKILAASGAVLLLAGWGVQAATATPQTDDTANTVTEDTSAAVSMEEAKTIALNDAGVNAEDARFYETKGDYEDGKVVYEIEFVAGNIEYDYEIDKTTGKILDIDYDAEAYAPAASNAISIDEAKKIALAKVSGASDQHIRIEADHDDGRLVYEGEIHYGRVEYEFEIDGSTGAIIEWDADYDD